MNLLKQLHIYKRETFFYALRALLLASTLTYGQAINIDINGKTFTWEVFTANSTVDNLRPIVPENHGYNAHALWFRGNYRFFTNFSTSVVGIFENDNAGLRSTAAQHNLSASPILGQKRKLIGCSTYLKMIVKLQNIPYNIICQNQIHRTILK